jgi:hypothetical protein
MTLDDFFEAARRSGSGVLVINELHIGDVITAENVAGGDINASRILSIPAPALSAEHALPSAAAFGESGPCRPAADHDHVWDWRVADLDQRASDWQREYARQCDEHWQNR